MNSIFIDPVLPKELKDDVKSLTNNNAPGWNQFILVQTNISKVIVVLLFIINLIVLGVFPTQLTNARVIPSLKVALRLLAIIIVQYPTSQRSLKNE